MTHNTPVLNGAAFRGYEDDVAGAITAQTPIAAANTNWSQQVNEKFHVAMVVEETADGGVNYASQLQYSLNGGTWTAVSGTTPIQVVTPTNCTTTDATIYTTTTALADGGSVIEGEYCTDNATGNTSIQLQRKEHTLCLQIDGAQVTAGTDTIELRLTDAGTANDTDTTIPTISPVDTAAKTVTGSTYADPDTYGSGSVASPGPLQTITGVAFADPDQYGAGSVASPGPLQTVTGATYADADLYGAGSVASPPPPDQTITGTAFADPDLYGTGSLDATYTITGATFSDPDLYGSGIFGVVENERLRPDADDSNAGWVNELDQSTNLFASLDEAAASDADFVKSPSSPNGEVLRLRLSDPTLNIDPAEPQSLSYRYGKDFDFQTLDFEVRLVQGAATNIATWNHLDVPVGFQTVQQNLTAPQIAAITDYTDLFVEIEATAR